MIKAAVAEHPAAWMVGDLKGVGRGEPGRAERGVLAGHMVRAQRALAAALRAVDVVWEVADARCPRASRNPRLARLCAGKPVVVVLAKSDLAEPEATRGWLAHLRERGAAVGMDLRRGFDLPSLVRASREAAAGVGARFPAEGLSAMVAGVPNTGKSTLLNCVSGGAHAAVGARAGVTRGEQWLRLPGGGRVLDLPGVLPPSLSAWPVVWRLWAVGALSLDASDGQRAGGDLAEWMAARAPRRLLQRYGVDPAEARAGYWLQAIARRRGFLVRGGEADETRAAEALLADYRRGLLGPVTLEDPPAVDEPRGQ